MLVPVDVGTDLQISAEECAQVIRSSIEKLNQFYVFPRTAKNMESALRSRVAKGEYRSIKSATGLAGKLTADLREVSKDEHLRVEYFAEQPPLEVAPNAPGASENFGFGKAERLEGNVGFIEINALYPAADAGETATAALTLVAHTDALIIDLRRCFGGEPTGLMFVLSYFFDEPTHVDDMLLRWPTESTRQLWTFPVVPGIRFGGHKPVYLLTSHQTYSGCEAFAYDLQAQKRAQIVGDSTMGAAHLTTRIPISKHFRIAVPFGRSVNPVTHADWEGTGVRPDMAAPGNRATEVAYESALRSLIEAAPDEDRKTELRKLLEHSNPRS
jgi:C-terminal processing protease CtpA/Prc